MFLLVQGCGAQAVEENLALGRSCTFSPEPNYPLCTDKEDKNQLTDGKTYGSWWVKKSTVGWRIYSSFPMVTIDLGRIELIEHVRVHSVGGGAARVYGPDSVIVLVSNDGTDFRCAGVVSPDRKAKVSPRKKRRSVILTVRNLRAKARYVRVIVQPGGPFVFLDEIDVIGAKERGDGHILPGAMPAFGSSTNMLQLVEKQIDLKDRITGIKDFITGSTQLSEVKKEKLSEELVGFEKRVFGESDRLYSSDEISVLSYELGLIRARLYKAIFQKPYAFLMGNSLENISSSDIMHESQSIPRLDFRLWRGEYESAVLNIVNCEQEPITIAGSLSPLVGADSKSIASDSSFQIRRAIFVNSRKAGFIADALVLQDERPFKLYPGETGQLWISLSGDHLRSGSYTASLGVLISSPDEKNAKPEVIPVSVTVDPIVFPEEATLNSCNWAYLKRSKAIGSAMSEAADDLREHYTNIVVVPPGNLPFPSSLARTNGLNSRELFKDLDELLAVHSNARKYLFFYGFKPARKDSGRFGKWMSSSWKKSYQVWLTGFVNHLKEKGIGYDRFAMYPFDEALGDEFYELAKVIKGIDPRIKIYANSFGSGPSDFVRFRNLVDIWCFSKSQCLQHPDWLITVKGFGRDAWLYDAMGPGKANDPHSYYRLLPWLAFKYGLTGAGFWVYSDPEIRIDSWDDTGSAVGHYGVVYSSVVSPVDTGSEKIVPSRRWEAWREGIEDYEYLRVYQDEIRKLKISSPRNAEKAQRLLEEYVDNVLSGWDDKDIVYEVRKHITQDILEMRLNEK